MVTRFVVGAGLILSIQGILEAQDEFNAQIALRHVKRANNLCSAAFKSFLKISKALDDGDDVSEEKLNKAVDKLTTCSEMVTSLTEDADAAISELTGDDQEKDPIEEDPGDDFEDEFSAPLTAAGKYSDSATTGSIVAPPVPTTSTTTQSMSTAPTLPPYLPPTSCSDPGLANNDGTGDDDDGLYS